MYREWSCSASTCDTYRRSNIKDSVATEDASLESSLSGYAQAANRGKDREVVDRRRSINSRTENFPQGIHSVLIFLPIVLEKSCVGQVISTF